MKKSVMVWAACLPLVVVASVSWAQGAQPLRWEQRTAVGDVAVSPDDAMDGVESVWFTDVATGEVFWAGVLDEMPPALQSFFRDVAATGQDVYLEGRYEWWADGNVIWNITGYGMH